jgi:pimeloyl-ACP methyl ester carboxylesterase
MAAPVALIGTSMGGHIACRLIAELKPQALVLFCPAAYAAAAEALPFGPELQHCLRTTTDFADSPAFDALERFDGRLLLVLGDDDAVIPAEVIHGYRTRARHAASVEVICLPTDHKLHRWLETRPDEAGQVLQRVLATLQA